MSNLRARMPLLLWIAVAAFSIGCGQPKELAWASPVAQQEPTKPQPSGQEGRWQLLFSDDFTGTSLDRHKWHTCYWWSEAGCTNTGNNELQWYVDGQVHVQDGMLRLRADERDIVSDEGEAFEYVSGIVTTGRHRYETSYRPRFAFQYGYVEMRARVPKGQGLWPAFWMLPATHHYRPEIDIMEILGHDTETIHMHLHSLTEGGDTVRSLGQWAGPDFSEGWHVFAVHWEPNAVVWYVDGVERSRVDDPGLVPSVPMYLLANLAVGGNWPGPPGASTQFPAFFDIDYIRVWKHENALHPGDTWRYFKGTSEPPAEWNTLNFDDTPWSSGPSGFGYGGGDDATLLSDMPGHYVSLYIRRNFVIEDPERLEQLTLYMDVSDGFVAYVNGVEVARSNVDGDPPGYDMRATSGMGPSLGTGGIAAFDLSWAAEHLVPGNNVIAIQGHNVGHRSSNFSLIPTLISITSPRSPGDQG